MKATSKRAKEDDYTQAFNKTRPPAPRKAMRMYSVNEAPEDPRARKVLRVNPYSTHQGHITQSPLKLGPLVLPEVPDTVAQPRRDNIMERPVYVPKAVEPPRPGSTAAFEIPSRGL